MQAGFHQTKPASSLLPGNEEVNIGQCLESLLDQDFPQDQMEIIVVDDQSVDQTAAIVRSYANRGIRLISLGKEEVIWKESRDCKGHCCRLASNHHYYRCRLPLCTKMAQHHAII